MIALYVISILSCILSVISLGYTIYCHIKVAAMEKSTHTVQMVPVDKEWDEENNKFIEEQKRIKERAAMNNISADDLPDVIL